MQGGHQPELRGVLNGFPFQEQLTILHVVRHDAEKTSDVLLHHILGSIAGEEETLVVAQDLVHNVLERSDRQPEEKELVETIVWIVLSWSLLRTAAESLKYNLMKIRMILTDDKDKDQNNDKNKDLAIL